MCKHVPCSNCELVPDFSVYDDAFHIFRLRFGPNIVISYCVWAY